MAKATPVQFFQQVRAELGKVTWPGRREVILTTVMVFAFAAIMATFFSVIDLGFRTGLEALYNYFNI